MEDIVIIGGGVIGTLIAYACSRYNCNVTLIEKENDVANSTSMANSAIIHAGYDPRDNTLKAAMNLRGAQLYPTLCRELKVDYKQVGSLVVAMNDEQCAALAELKARADQRGIVVSLIDGDEARALESHLSNRVVQALFCESTAIVTPWKIAIAAMETAMGNGTRLLLNEEVKAITKLADGYEVESATQKIKTRMVINCAGLYADRISAMVNGQAHFKINPKKGEYFVLSKRCHELVKHVLYPVPTAKGKGVLAVPTIHGNILLGPNAAEHDDCDDVATTSMGLAEVLEKTSEMLDEVPASEIIHSFSGNRPTTAEDDFIIEESCPHFIDVAGIDSPGLASAPAIAEKVMKEFVLPAFDLQPRSILKHRQKNVVLSECGEEEKKQYIAHNPRYGEIICRCEQVSAQEIIDCIKRSCGARSVVGVKKRVRPGMGDCQGGFCEPLVVRLLSETLKIPMEEVDYNQKGSHILYKMTKGER